MDIIFSLWYLLQSREWVNINGVSDLKFVGDILQNYSSVKQNTKQSWYSIYFFFQEESKCYLFVLLELQGSFCFGMHFYVKYFEWLVINQDLHHNLHLLHHNNICIDF